MLKRVNFKAKEWILLILSFVFLTDLLIVLNIPFLRELLALVCFTIVPGYLILIILKLNKIEFLKKVLLSIGLSIAFLMMEGLFINSFYPYISKPLSLIPLLVLINFSLIIMALIYYWRNKYEVYSISIPNLRVHTDKLSFPLILPILFPFMAILGTYLMNTSANNVILLAMLLLMPFYLIIVVFLRDKIHNYTYPFSLWLIALSLLLMHGLSSYHIFGRDVQFEYHFFQTTLANFHWSVMSDIPKYSTYNECISITILPTIYKVLSNFNSEYLFKLFFGVIGSIIPLIIYVISNKYTKNLYAFFISLLFTFQFYFIYILGLVRQEFAFIFFFLVILVILDNKIGKNAKKILFLLLMISMIFSHYTTSYISLVIIIPIMLAPFLKDLLKNRKINLTNFDIIFILLVFLLIWYILVASTQVTMGSSVVSSASTSGEGGFEGGKDNKILGIFGIGIKSVPNLISILVNDTILLLIGLGLLMIVMNYKSFNKKFQSEYFMGVLISPIILLLFVILPNLSIAYDIQRIFLQLIVFLGIPFICGVNLITGYIKKPNLKPIIITVILILLFSCSTYLQYHFYGEPYSPYYENNSHSRYEHYMYDQEIIAGKWLKNYGYADTVINSDALGPYRLILSGNNCSMMNYNYFVSNQTKNGYLYLRYVNIRKKVAYLGLNNSISINTYPNLLDKNIIYNNGDSRILL